MKTIPLGSLLIGDDHPTFVIAEAGINHQGDIAIARQLIDVAAEAQADAVKFQKRDLQRILTSAGLAMPYQNRNSFGDTYGEHKRALELGWEEYTNLKEYAEAQGLIFLASAWDEESVDFLEKLGVVAHKLASADLTNKPLLAHVAQTGKPLILSTGMSELWEVDEAVALVRQYHDNFVLLQCTSTYPSDFAQINLRVMPMYQQRYSCLVGFSGHEKGIAVSSAAVALGACVLERHFTLDRTMKGGDHAASLEPLGLGKLVRDVRAIELALGDGQKVIYAEEQPVRQKLAKSVVTAVDIPAGTTLTRAMLTTKGPGTGISAGKLDSLIGHTTQRDLPADVVIQPADINW
jgi:sialic acid synthase